MAELNDKANENARRQLGEDRKVRDQAHREYEERMKGKPTPTQEENDLAKLGAHILEHEDDGSGPEIVMTLEAKRADPHKQRTLESGGAGSYSTRQSTASSSSRSSASHRSES